MRLEDGAAVFAVGDRSVRVEGDADFVARVISRCDGALPVAGIAAELGEPEQEVGELLALLDEHGVVVEATEAYRLFHRESSTDSGLFHRLTDEYVAALLEETFRPERVLAERVALAPGATRMGEIAGARRSSVARGQGREPSFEEVSAIVATMYGRGRAGTRAVPSAGGLYPLAIHVAVREPLGPLEPGLWWFDPGEGTLALVRRGRPDVESAILPEPGADALVARRHPVAFVSADIDRSARKYANRAYRYVNMEVGAAMQNAYLAGAELGVPVRAIGGFADRATAELLDLRGRAEPLLVLLLGA